MFILRVRRGLFVQDPHGKVRDLEAARLSACPYPLRSACAPFAMGRFSNVSYILLAEFDIDAGSLLSRQLPWPTGVDPQLLAELMLPEGVHDVEQDWTVFMLNQTPENTCQIVLGDEPTEDDSTLDLGAGGSQPLLHGLNLVFRKYDPNVKRKWTVKALAICTHHPFIHMFKVRGSTKAANVCAH